MRGDFWTAQHGNHIFGVIPGNSDAKHKKQDAKIVSLEGCFTGKN